MTDILEVRGLDATYGKAVALESVSFSIPERSVVGLLGRNGAGKSTTFKAIMGVEVNHTGSVRLGGEDVSRWRAHKRYRAGISWVPEDRRIVPQLTVRENLRLAARGAREDEMPLGLIHEALPLLEPLMDRKGHQLSGGEQQAVAIARGLVSRPKILLLDEPIEGLSPLIVEQLSASIARLPELFELSVLLAEQSLDFVLGLSKQVHVLEDGRVAYSGSSDAFAQDEALQRKFLSVSR